MEQAIEYFSIFGGVKIATPFDQDIDTLVKERILEKYKFLRNDISTITKGEGKEYAILSALATGDRRTNSSFRKTQTSFNDGIEIVDRMCNKKMLILEKSMQELTALPKNSDISEKLLFTTPFTRFWFTFISPYFKGIRDGNYDEFFEVFHKKFQEFQSLIFEQLAHEYVKNIYAKQCGDIIYKVGRYWDDKCEIDLLCKTKSGKVLAGVCSYKNGKMKKQELTKLQNLCEKLGIQVDTYILFAKSGFSNELKALKGDSLRLFTVKSLVALVDEKKD